MTEPSDPFEQWLGVRPVEPLAPPEGVFDRIARSARRRRLANATGTAAAVLVLITAIAGVMAAFAGSDPGADLEPASPDPSVAMQTPAPTGPTPSVTVSGSPAVGHTPAGTTGGHTPAGTTGGPSRCTTGQLRITVASGDNAAGHIGLRIVFTNTGTRTCTLYGYPGVSFQASPTGPQINDPAQRSPAQGAPTRITLAPGHHAHADLLLVNVANYPSNLCKPAQIAGVRVYPPDQTTAAFAASPQQVCTINGTGLAQIYPIQAGS